MKNTDYLHQLPHIREGLDHLLTGDRVFKTLKTKPEDLLWSYTGPGFPSLVRIVIGQQVSTAAARSMWEKFQGGVKAVEPKYILKLEDDEMRALGLSGQKIKYIRGLSEAVKGKSFDPHALEAMEDDAVYAAITALNGFGRWSAEMYLMFSLARPDVWAPNDLGIQYGLQHYLKLKDRPDMERTMMEGKRFAPHRTAASLLLWHLKTVRDAEKKVLKTK